jgi:protein-serine/threonine kinase
MPYPGRQPFQPYPGSPREQQLYGYDSPRNADLYNPYFQPYPHNAFSSRPLDAYEQQETTSVPAGTFLHKGFYDLLSMIPTPSPSRLLWKAPAPPPETVLAGPRYEDMNANTGTRAMPKKGRRISKDMVSKPTGFVYVLYSIYPNSAIGLTLIVTSFMPRIPISWKHC